MAMTDRAALSALFRSTGGAEWHRKDNWDSDADLSRWLGVEVDARGRVTHLRLEKNNLKGHIPRQLGDLGALQTLNLGYNELYGPIPPELGNLAALQGLYLGDNTLSGPIPPDLGGLSKLETFWLSKNKLTGPIPPELGNLAALQGLYLGDNTLSGHITPELALSELQVLGLGGNELTGPIPEELGKLTAVKELYLNRNKLSGHIPPELGALSELRVLSLFDNKLTGTIPKELGKLTALQRLSLFGNQLSGPMPPSNFAENPQELSRWVQIRPGQNVDVRMHSHALGAVNVLTSLWHFFLPVLDDATDLWLLLETFGGSRRGLWWTCLCVFVIADIERVYTAFFLVVLLLTSTLGVFSSDRFDFSHSVSFLAGQSADVLSHGHLFLDSLLWTLFGSRARSSPFMRTFGLAGDSSGQAIQQTGFGLHAIDVMVFFHPFRYFGEFVMSFPPGHRRPEASDRNTAHRRKISMVRAVGETLWVDPLFLALSVVTGGWDDNIAGLTAFSALFSVLELVTELQYYVTEAEDGNSLAAVGDVEDGVGGSENSRTPSGQA